MANDDVIERAEQLLLEPIVNRMAAGERACQLVIDLVVELRASRARVAVLLEKASEANDELSGATGLTPGDQIKIDSALTIIDAAMGDGGGEVMASEDVRIADLARGAERDAGLYLSQSACAELLAEVRELRRDRERLGFVLRHCLPIELWFSEDEMVTVESIDEIDAAMEAER